MGYVDPAVAIPEMVDKLGSSGLETYMELNRQRLMNGLKLME